MVCLLGALRLHGLTTQLPFEVWMAIDRHAAKPRVRFPQLRIMRFSRSSFSEGVDEHLIEGVNVRVYSAAKTVVDCYKFRNRIGVDVAVEALRDCRGAGHCDDADLLRYATACRMRTVMQPYVEGVG